VSWRQDVTVDFTNKLVASPTRHCHAGEIGLVHVDTNPLYLGEKLEGSIRQCSNSGAGVTTAGAFCANPVPDDQSAHLWVSMKGSAAGDLAPFSLTKSEGPMFVGFEVVLVLFEYSEKPLSRGFNLGPREPMMKFRVTRFNCFQHVIDSLGPWAA
jgi:hypothetical protein